MYLDHKYKGFLIRLCAHAASHQGRWIIQAYHKTGVELTDELCLHVQTLAGVSMVPKGNYVIKGSMGELYMLDAETFKRDYETI